MVKCVTVEKRTEESQLFNKLKSAKKKKKTRREKSERVEGLKESKTTGKTSCWLQIVGRLKFSWQNLDMQHFTWEYLIW